MIVARSSSARPRRRCRRGGHADSVRHDRPAEAAKEGAAGGAQTVARTVCTHCSVGARSTPSSRTGLGAPGAGVRFAAELGAHCAKGASVREHGHGEHRLKSPMKLVNASAEAVLGAAINEVATSSSRSARNPAPTPRSGWAAPSTTTSRRTCSASSCRCSHEQHGSQARICHSTTVAAWPTPGLRAMTNSYNDMQNSKCALYIGSNAAEAHPGVDAAHAACEGEGREDGGRRPAVHADGGKADEYVRIRSGTDIPFLFGLLHHIFKNGWKTSSTSTTRLRDGEGQGGRAAKWTPAAVEEACGVPSADGQGRRDARKNKPSTIVGAWADAAHDRNAMVRAS